MLAVVVFVTVIVAVIFVVFVAVIVAVVFVVVIGVPFRHVRRHLVVGGGEQLRVELVWDMLGEIE